MAKDKEFEKKYKEEYSKRSKQRALKRKKKWIAHAKRQIEIANGMCPNCGEKDYCYCGSNTPGVIDY